MKRFILPALAAALLAGAQGDRVTVEELRRLLAEGRPVVVLDVRGHADRVIKGARHIPLDQLEARAGELPRGREVVTYCA